MWWEPQEQCPYIHATLTVCLSSCTLSASCLTVFTTDDPEVWMSKTMELMWNAPSAGGTEQESGHSCARSCLGSACGHGGVMAQPSAKPLGPPDLLPFIAMPYIPPGHGHGLLAEFFCSYSGFGLGQPPTMAWNPTSSPSLLHKNGLF